MPLTESETFRDCTGSGGSGKQKVLEHPKVVSMRPGIEIVSVQEMKNMSHTKPCSEKKATIRGGN